MCMYNSYTSYLQKVSGLFSFETGSSVFWGLEGVKRLWAGELGWMKICHGILRIWVEFAISGKGVEDKEEGEVGDIIRRIR